MNKLEGQSARATSAATLSGVKPGLIGMPNPLHADGLVDYEAVPAVGLGSGTQITQLLCLGVSMQDGTPCTKSQMAKDAWGPGQT